jgi:hypothetical protein
MKCCNNHNSSPTENPTNQQLQPDQTQPALCNYREREFVQRFNQADLDLGSKSPPGLLCTAKELGSLIPRITKWNEHLKDHDANYDDCLSAKEVCRLYFMSHD